MNVAYIDHMGTDLSVVNAAKVSFNRLSTEVGENEKRLINFLARGYTKGDWEAILKELCEFGHDFIMFGAEEDFRTVEAIVKEVRSHAQHWSPFAHTCVSLRVKAPIFVARQLVKHQVGLAWNEVSRRYVDETPKLYWPEYMRSRADNKKQGSGGYHVEWNDSAEDYQGQLEYQVSQLISTYENMIEKGVCPEQARMILPQNMYTEWVWTGSVLAFSRVCLQRMDDHAQFETRLVAEKISDVIKPLFPVSWEALTT